MDVELETVELDPSDEASEAQQSSYICHYCNQSFVLKCNLVSHIRAHIGDKPHSCEVCFESFSTRSGLALHFRIHKSTGQAYRSTSPENHRFICNYCDKGFSLKSNLILHIRTHTGERPYRCSYCNKTSATKYNLLSHIKTHYSEKTIKCGYCDKYFSTRKNLHSHVQIHISTKRYYCSYCDKSSIHKGTLRVHERIHTGERPYKCIYCSKSFNHRSNLTHHVRIHTGERPFTCKYCDKAFRQKYALDGHERIHTGVKPFVCVDCNKSFPYSASLRSHMKVHDGDQVYTCYYCMRSFTSKISLSLHIRVHLCSKNAAKKYEYVKKEDEVLLQQALASQSVLPVRKNSLKEDPLTSSDADQQPATDPLQVKTESHNEQVGSVVDMLLTPELENGLVKDSSDNSSSSELKNRLREQLCKFIDKYSLKNITPNKKVVFKSVTTVSPASPKPKLGDAKPLLKTNDAATNHQNTSQTSVPTSSAECDNSTDSDRAKAIAEIDKLGLKERISAQLKTIVNSGLAKKERKQGPAGYRSVVAPPPPPPQNNLKHQMNNRLQKLLQNNLAKRFDTLASQRVEQKPKQEIVPVKVEDEKAQEVLHCTDEITRNLTSDLAEKVQSSDDQNITEDILLGDEIVPDPITEVHIKVETTEETEEGAVLLCL